MQPPGYTLNMKIGELIKEARAAKGWKAARLARKAGVDPATILRIERGESLGRSESIAWITEALELEPAVVQAALRESGAPWQFRAVLRTPQELFRELAEITPLLIPEREWPISAGPGVPAEQELWPYWPGPGERGHEFTVVRVTGTCMEPRIREGERVVVDVSASARPGDFVAAEHDGERLVKRLEQRGGDLWLVALQGQPPIKVDGATEIIGVVRMVMHRP